MTIISRLWGSPTMTAELGHPPPEGERIALNLALSYNALWRQLGKLRMARDGEDGELLLIGDQNTGRATLDQLCAAWRPVSNAQQCAAATKRSGDVQQRAQQLQWQPRQYGGGDEVGADGFVVNGRGSEEFERAAEWSAVLTSECERIAESPKKKKALEKHFKGGPVSAFKLAGRGNTVLLGGAAEALQQALLVEPYKRINLLLAQAQRRPPIRRHHRARPTQGHGGGNPPADRRPAH